MSVRIIACTVAALIAFAGNSVLCRLALGNGAIDAASFTSIRLLAGAAALLAIQGLSASAVGAARGRWTSPLILVAYAIPFSFAYVSLPAGTGALILFGTVQVTMLVSAIVSGSRPHAQHWLGLTIALAGLVYLVMPGLEAPPPFGAALMALAGVAWAFYTLAGRQSRDPIGETAANFVRSAPFALLLLLIGLPRAHISASGATLAAVSGAFTSGVGYVLWYVALRRLSAVRAAAVQLMVPVLAALAGVLLLNETFTLRLLFASVLVLGGIAITLTRAERASRS